MIPVAAFISPTNQIIEMAKSIIGEDNFLEVFISTPLEECERRDIKGLYKKARKGDIKDFTGISSPFEAPENPFLNIDTTGKDIKECIDIILESVLSKVSI